MTDQTDRIKQMAQEAGIDIDPHEGIHRAYSIHLAKFAALVAEDCARVADNSDFGPIPHHIGDQIRARYAIAKPPEAG